MQKHGNTWLWTNKCTTLELRDLIAMRRKWRNSSQSFEGHSMTDVTRKHTLDLIKASDELGADIRIEFFCDTPDYCVFSNGLPILWHSTTTAKDSGWVAPLSGRVGFRQGLQTCIELVDAILPWLNESDY